jgi:hypothetical protein
MVSTCPGSVGTFLGTICLCEGLFCYWNSRESLYANAQIKRVERLIEEIKQRD